MLVKIAHFLLLVVNTFTQRLPAHRPWEIFLEGMESLTFNLNEGPNYLQTMGIFARTQFLPSYHMQTFEEMFATSFIESGLSIFGPTAPQDGLRYITYKDAESGDPAFQYALFKQELKKREELQKATIPK